MATPISTDEALALLQTEGKNIYALLARANQVRIEHRGYTVNLCGIVNAKSGHCSEDCRFCAQSAHNSVDINCYDLLAAEEIISRSQASVGDKATRFGIVTSGLAIADESELSIIEDAIGGMAASEGGARPCASLGNVSKETLTRLKDAGLTRYHCNLETAESYYSEICTTRDWKDAYDTVKIAKELGLAVCCGGLLGLGESLAQRVELFESIRELDVDSVPLNFFNPVDGTRVNIPEPISALECLKALAVARLMMPDKEIRACGGREHNLGDLQSWVLISGADGLMVGGYLTTRGRSVEADLKMIEDAGFQIADHD